MAEGIWSCFPHRGTQKFNWDQGLYITNGKSVKDAVKQLEKDIDEGLHWNNYEIGGDYDDLLEDWTEQTTDLATRKKFYMTCNQKSISDPMVQFCMFSTFSADRRIYAQHKYGFCRAGAADTATAPKCPATACYNQSCTKCACGWSKNGEGEGDCVKITKDMSSSGSSSVLSIGMAIAAVALAF